MEPLEFRWSDSTEPIKHKFDEGTGTCAKVKVVKVSPELSYLVEDDDDA